LGTVAAAGLAASVDAQRVEHAANDLVTHTRQVADTTAADQHDRVLLQIVTFAGNIGGDFLAVGEPDASHLPQSRVRLLRGHGLNLQADAPLLRTSLQQRRLALGLLRPPRLADELIDRGHRVRLRLEGSPPGGSDPLKMCLKPRKPQTVTAPAAIVNDPA